MDKNSFQVVVIGTDVNAYGVARAFHEAFGVKTKVFGKARLLMTDDSSIVDVSVVDNFDDDKVMVDCLKDYALKNSTKKLILMAASENYVFRIFSNYENLKESYFIPYTEPKQGLFLSDKMNFYELCQEHGIGYPKAELVKEDMYSTYEPKFSFPLVLKPSESTDYFSLDFEGKEKAYILHKAEDLHKSLKDIYENGYNHDMIVQEYVEGPVTNEFVVNLYSDKNAKVRMISIGRIAIDDPNPELRGNYVAIVSTKLDSKIKNLLDGIVNFLEKLEFKGLSNFDIKLDDRDGEYKAFEINLRQGRSSYCSIMAGANYAIPIIEDAFGQTNDSLVYGNDEFVWLNCTNRVFRKVLKKDNPELYNEVKNIKNIASTLRYSKDLSIIRALKLMKYFNSYDKKVLNRKRV